MIFFFCTLWILLGGTLASASAGKRVEHRIVGTSNTHGIASVDYPKMAGIAPKHAVDAATRLVPGRVMSLALESEDGFLVYAVEITHPLSGVHEILVDAGSGKILRDEVMNGRVGSASQ